MIAGSMRPDHLGLASNDSNAWFAREVQRKWFEGLLVFPRSTRRSMGHDIWNVQKGAVCCLSGSGWKTEKADVRPTTPFRSFGVLSLPPKACH